MLVIGVITLSFHFSGFQAVMEQKKKKWSILAQWTFLLPLFLHMQNITELNVLLQSKWGKEIIDIRKAATSLGYSVGFVFPRK